MGLTRKEREGAERQLKKAFWFMCLVATGASVMGYGGVCVVSMIWALLFSLVIGHAEWLRMKEEEQEQDPDA